MELAVMIPARMRWAGMWVGGGLLSLGMAGCKVGPKDVTQDLALIGSFTESLGTDAIAEASRLRSWWTHFRDPTLDRLIGHAITGNLDVQMLHQRLEQARAHKQIAGARLMPQVGGLGLAQEGYASRTLTKPRGYGAYRVYMAGFDATWELDVFGGIRRREEAAEDEVQAMIEHRRAAMVSVISELASDYATLRATQHRIAIAERNLNTARRVTHLTQRKYAQGVISNLAVAQAKAQLAVEEAELTRLHADVAQLTHSIAVLCGDFPGALEAELSTPAPRLRPPTSLPDAVPSEVLKARPDIRRARRELAAATAQVGVARAEQYPHFSIPLILRPDTSYMRQFFQAQSLLWSAGMGVAQPVSTGGRLTAQVDAAQARREEARQMYRQTVLHAFQEVEDALVRYNAAGWRVNALRDSVAHNHQAFDRAQALYDAGLTDFLNLLDAERDVYAAEDSLSRAELARLRHLIALYKALGGGWQSVTFADEGHN